MEDGAQKECSLSNTYENENWITGQTRARRIASDTLQVEQSRANGARSESSRTEHSNSHWNPRTTQLQEETLARGRFDYAAQDAVLHTIINSSQ